MQTTPKASFNVQLMADDMALKGWTRAELARRARVADMTVIRFFRGEGQTAPTAKKIADALGRPLKRYLVSAGEAFAS